MSRPVGNKWVQHACTVLAVGTVFKMGRRNCSLATERLLPMEYDVADIPPTRRSNVRISRSVR